MVLLTIVTNSNPHTLYFDHPIERPSYIRLLSTSLYNSWYNLKEDAIVSSLGGSSNGNPYPEEYTMKAGHYTIDFLAKELNNIKKYDSTIDMIAKTNMQIGSMTIYTKLKRVIFSQNLIDLLGANPALSSYTPIKRFTSPSTYFVHCYLIDKRQNLLSGKPSTVLARFDIRGQPFEKVHYQTPQQHVLCDTSTGDYDVNSLTISVKDEKGNLFDFNGQPLEFEVEIN